MNVPSIGQGQGSVATLSRTVTGAGTGVAARVEHPTAISFTRLAWFDVNGDGSIDSRSAADGGDATLLVPSHGVDLPTYSRPAHPMGGGRPVREKDSGRGTSPPAVGSPNSAQANRAADAYERYGQTPPAPPAPPVAPVTPAPVPATADVSTVVATAAPPAAIGR